MINKMKKKITKIYKQKIKIPKNQKKKKIKSQRIKKNRKYYFHKKI